MPLWLPALPLPYATPLTPSVLPALARMQRRGGERTALPTSLPHHTPSGLLPGLLSSPVTGWLMALRSWRAADAFYPLTACSLALYLSRGRAATQRLVAANEDTWHSMTITWLRSMWEFRRKLLQGRRITMTNLRNTTITAHCPMPAMERKCKQLHFSLLSPAMRNAEFTGRARKRRSVIVA